MSERDQNRIGGAQMKHGCTADIWRPEHHAQ